MLYFEYADLCAWRECFYRLQGSIAFGSRTNAHEDVSAMLSEIDGSVESSEPSQKVGLSSLLEFHRLTSPNCHLSRCKLSLSNQGESLDEISFCTLIQVS